VDDAGDLTTGLSTSTATFNGNISIANGNTITLTGTLPSGTAATYACFTSAGKLISSSSAC
jgi:DNA-binding beta-propeller fold protein YncE